MAYASAPYLTATDPVLHIRNRGLREQSQGMQHRESEDGQATMPQAGAS